MRVAQIAFARQARDPALQPPAHRAALADYRAHFQPVGHQRPASATSIGREVSTSPDRVSPATRTLNSPVGGARRAWR